MKNPGRVLFPTNELQYAITPDTSTSHCVKAGVPIMAKKVITIKKRDLIIKIKKDVSVSLKQEFVLLVHWVVVFILNYFYQPVLGHSIDMLN